MRSIFILLVLLTISSCQDPLLQYQKTTKTPLAGSYSKDAAIEQTLNTLVPGADTSYITGTKDGRPYRITNNNRPDNKELSGSISQWHFDCKTDKIDDKIRCKVSKDTAENAKLLNVIVYHIEQKTICVGYHDFPYKSSSIRLDNSSAINISAKSKGCIAVSDTLLSKLKNGQNITTRGYIWPYDNTVDRTVTMDGFDEALKLVDWVKNGMKVLQKNASNKPL